MNEYHGINAARRIMGKAGLTGKSTLTLWHKTGSLVPWINGAIAPSVQNQLERSSISQA